MVKSTDGAIIAVKAFTKPTKASRLFFLSLILITPTNLLLGKITNKTLNNLVVLNNATANNASVSNNLNVGKNLDVAVNLNAQNINAKGLITTKDANVTGNVHVAGNISGNFKGDVHGNLYGNVYGNTISTGNIVLTDSPTDIKQKEILDNDSKTKTNNPIDETNLLNSNTSATEIDNNTTKTPIKPALTFQGDLTTGLYHKAPGNLAIVTNGVEQLTIDPDGNVNITGKLNGGNQMSIGNTTITETAITTGNTTITSNAVTTGNSTMSSSAVSTGRIILADENDEFRATKAVIHPSLTFSSDLTTGIYRPRGDGFAFATDGVKRLHLTQAGDVAITNFGTTQGLVHNNDLGVLANSLLVDSDITAKTITNASIANNTITSEQIANNTITDTQIATNAQITDTKLDTIKTTGKVLNSATTATELNVSDAIVKRDLSGNFETNNIKLNDVELASITKNGSTILWPTGSGSINQYLAVVAPGQLGFAVAEGSGNVSTLPSGFTKDNLILVTDKTAGGTNIKETSITIDTNNDISGINSLSAASISGNLFGNVTGTASGNVNINGDAIKGPLSFPAGWPGAPSLAFTGDPDTGIFNPINGTVAITTDGTEKFNVNSAGNVSIKQFGLTGGVVHNYPAGYLTNSLIIDGDITPLTITNASIAANTITAGQILDNTITSTQIADNTITAGQIANNTITATQIAANTITAGQIANNTITNTQIASNAAIADTKLATITTPGTVANTATTATGTNLANAIVARDSSGNFSAGTITAALTGNVTGNLTGNVTGNLTGNVTGNVSGSSSTFTGSLLGDITGTQSATVVRYVGGGETGVNQEQIISGVNTANAATNANTASTVVKRDSSGNFSANTITANLTGNVTGNVTGNLYGIADKATTAVNFSGPLGASGGDITGLQGNLTVNTVGGQLAAYIATGAYLANSATKDNTFNAIVRRGDQGEFSAGTITATGGFIGNVTGNLTGNADTATSAITAGSTPKLTGEFGASGGDISGSQPLLTVNSVGSKTSTQIAQATDLALSATSNEVVNTIVKRDSSGNFIANMITLNTNAIANPNDVTTKQYVDTAVAAGLVPKNPAIVVATDNVAITGLYSIDGVTITDSDRVLLVGQTNQINNGLWVAHTGAWTRPTDFANGSEAMGAYVLILSGDANAGTSWLCDTPSTIIGTNDVNFVQFSLPDATKAANVGSGAGQIYRDKTGVTLNLKTLAALSHIAITNNANDISLGTDATPNNATGTIISRDANGNFSANNMTGAASLNVLKAGDIMTGNLTMANQAAILLGASGSNYVGLRAPATMGSSYTIDLPNIAPTANQILQAISATGTTWTTLSPAPGTTQNYYVSLAGSDSNNGSLSAPFRSVKQAVIAANNLPASLTSPVAINVGPGIFYEDNSGGGIQINVDGVNIIGSSLASTIIYATDVSASNDLFVVTKPNVEFCDLILRTTEPNPQISAIKLNTTSFGNSRFSSMGVDGFKYGFSLNSSSTPSQLALFDNIQCINNETCISVSNNISTVIQSSVFQGSSTGTPANKFLSSTGANAQVDIIGCGLKYFDTCVSAVGGTVRVSASNVENSKYGILCSNGCKCYITSLNSILNHDGFINVSAQDSGTIAYIEGSMFDCKGSLSTLPTGTAVQCTSDAIVNISSTTIENANIGLYVSGSILTQINSNGVNLIHCPTDIKQGGLATLSFVGGTIEQSVVDFEDPTNISLAAFNSNGETTLSFGNTTDNQQMIYNLQNGQPILPNLIYEPNYYGSKGTVFRNSNTGANATPTFSGVESESSDASYYVVTGKNTQQAKIDLISDTADIGGSDNKRGWEISKLGNTNADLAFTYANNDPGITSRGANPVMQLDGFDNKVQFPAAQNSTLPTYNTARLTWGENIGDTTSNLYRSATGTLATDANFVVGGNLTIPAGYLPATPSLSFSDEPSTGIYKSSEGKIAIATFGLERFSVDGSGSVAINQFGTTGGIIHNDSSGILTNSLIFNSDITANTITESSIANGTITNTSIASNAEIADTKLATISTAGKVSNSATTATGSNVANAIVTRDASGNFSAGIITAALTGNVTGNLTGNVSGTVTGGLIGNVTGAASLNVLKAGDTMTGNLTVPTVIGNLTGNVTGNVVGAASLNVLKAGDTMTGTLVVPTVEGNLTGNVTGNLTGVVTGSLIGNVTGAASNNVLKAGDTMTGNLTVPTVYGNLTGNVTGNLTGNVLGSVTGAASFNVLKSGDTMTGNLTVPTVYGDLTGNVTGNLLGSVTGAASLNVLKSGDTMTGNLTVPTVYGNVTGNVTGNLTGNVTGNVLGNVTGAASLNVLKSGDTMTGSLTVPTVYSHLIGSLTGNVTGSASENVLKSGDTMTGNLTVPTVYGNLFGNVTGSASENVLKSGDTMTGNLTVPTVYGNLTGNVTGNVSGSAATFTGSLSGDVTSTQNATVVSYVGGATGVTQAQIISGVNLANAATSDNAEGTIVKRDSTGNFSAGTITATLTGAASLNVLKAGDTMTGTLNMGNQNITGVNITNSTTVNSTTINATTLNANAINATGITMTGNITLGGNNITGASLVNATTFYGNLVGNVTGAASANLLLSGGAMTGPLTLQQAGFSRSSSTVTLADGDYLDLTTSPASTSDIIYISGSGIPTSVLLANTGNSYPVGTIKIIHNVDTTGYIAFYSRVQTNLSFMLGDLTAAAGILPGHSKMIICVASGTNGIWSALN